MPSISSKAQHMPASPIRKLVPFSEAAKAAGKTVFHLNIGQPDIHTPEVALEAIRNYSDKVIAYSNSEGNLSYRKGMVDYYKSKDIDVEVKDVMVTTGGSEALLFAFQTCFDPGDELIIPEPFYANYNGFAVSAGVKVVPVTSYIESGFALPPVADFEKLVNEKTKGILICNPGNPTGYLYRRVTATS
jgi:aspartate aminotransferase